MKTPTPDFSISQTGSIALLALHSEPAWEAARKELAFENWQIIYGNLIAVEPKQAEGIRNIFADIGLIEGTP